MAILDRVTDAGLLWEHGRLKGAFLSALIAVVAMSRRQYPGIGDRQAFENFLHQGVFERISVEYCGECLPIYRIFYK